LVFKEGEAVAQEEFALLQPLDLQLVALAHQFEGFDGRIQIAMLFAQSGGFGLEGGALFVTQFIGHAPKLPKKETRRILIPDWGAIMRAITG
jgi:hypothetical protein